MNELHQKPFRQQFPYKQALFQSNLGHPENCGRFETMTETFVERRKGKVTEEQAKKIFIFHCHHDREP